MGQSLAKASKDFKAEYFSKTVKISYFFTISFVFSIVYILTDGPWTIRRLIFDLFLDIICNHGSATPPGGYQHGEAARQ